MGTQPSGFREEGFTLADQATEERSLQKKQLVKKGAQPWRTLWSSAKLKAKDVRA